MQGCMFRCLRVKGGESRWTEVNRCATIRDRSGFESFILYITSYTGLCTRIRIPCIPFRRRKCPPAPFLLASTTVQTVGVAISVPARGYRSGLPEPTFVSTSTARPLLPIYVSHSAAAAAVSIDLANTI